MALIKCKECGKEISSEAPTCPGCGTPIKTPRKGLGCGGIFIIIFIGIIVLYYIGDAVVKSTTPTQKKYTSKIISTPSPTRDEVGEHIEKYRRLQPERKKFIQEFLNDGTIIKITKNAQYPHVFVGAKFYTLTYDNKELLMQLIRLTYMTDDREADIVSIYDGYSGKQLGRYDEYGLHLD